MGGMRMWFQAIVWWAYSAQWPMICVVTSEGASPPSKGKVRYDGIEQIFMLAFHAVCCQNYLSYLICSSPP